MTRVAQALTQVKSRIQTVRTALKRVPAIPISILFIVILTAIFADYLVPHSPYAATLAHMFRPPFWAEGGSTTYLLGTDPLGRDILSRMILGARVSLIVVAAALLLVGLVGTVLGLMAGWYGGKIDMLISRAIDVSLSFPTILLALLFAVVLGPSFLNVMIVIFLVVWSRYARVVRGEVLSWKHREFVAYARVAGASSLRIIVRHLFPNVLNTLVVLLTFQAGYVILLEATLSFLGAGVPPPTPSWGSMASEGRQYIGSAWWVSVLPGLAIVLVVLSLNMAGDWLRDYLDPKLRQI